MASVPGSLLMFNLVTSQAGNRARQDSRINLTNTHESQAVALRLMRRANYVRGARGT